MIKHENNEELELVLNENGTVDLEFYYHEAEQLRAEYISLVFKAASKKVKSFFSSCYDAISCPKCFFHIGQH